MNAHMMIMKYIIYSKECMQYSTVFILRFTIIYTVVNSLEYHTCIVQVLKNNKDVCTRKHIGGSKQNTWGAYGGTLDLEH